MRKKIFNYLDQLKHGYLNITTPDNHTIEVGDSHSDLRADITIHDWALLDLCLSKGDVGLGEGYIEKLFTTTNIANLLLMLCLNYKELGPLFTTNRLYSLIFAIKNRLKKNSLKGSKKNIAYHYDLGNDFYQLWLDESMSYSSGIFTEQDDLAQSQYNKYQRILDELDVKGERILEIGCGWGGFIEQAAKRSFNTKGLTLSHEQKSYTDHLISNKQLNATTALQDYRHETEQYDSIVSIEMFEAVGKNYWDIYFNKLKQCLKKEGKAVIQTITINEELFHTYQKNSDYIREYIFPGGFLPTPSIFKKLAEKHGLFITNEFNFASSYSKTLLKWLDNFNQVRSKVRQLGYDERFIRQWQFYLAFCAAGFSTKRTDVIQYSLCHH